MVCPLLLALLLSTTTTTAIHTTRSFWSGGEVDHLQPKEPWPSEDGALLQYMSASMTCYTENLSIRREKNGKYILKVWEALQNSIKPSDLPANVAPPRHAEREVPGDIALSACQLWADALAKVREEKSNVMICDGQQDYYAGFRAGKVWTQGMANTPSLDLPPKWIEEAADALMEFGWQGDAPKCRKALAELQHKFSAYEKNHP